MKNKFDPGAPVTLSDFLKKAEPDSKRAKSEFLKTDEPRLVAAKPRRRRGPTGRPGRKPPWRLAHLVALSIEPGHWYGSPDIARLVGRPRRPLDVIIRRMVRDGELERWEDPAWAPRRYHKGEGVDVQGRDRPCRYLWRLTEKGLDLRREAVLLD